jgi:glycosyltransferase involved in cell wall biosynthesis
MSNLRVLHLSNTNIRSDSRILKEMNALAGCEKKYTLYAIGVQTDEGSIESAQSRLMNIDSINLRSRGFRYLPRPARHLLSLLELTAKMTFKALLIKPIIIHCHDAPVLPLGAIIKVMTGSKLIYDAHELESDRNGLAPLLSKAILIAEKVFWPFVDHLITVSPSIEKWYQINIGNKPSKIILNSPTVLGVGASRGGFDKSYLRRKYEISANEKIFIYVGILGRGRGIEGLLDVFSDSPAAHLVFMGYGELEKTIIKIVDLHAKIHLHPAVPHEDVVDVIRSADVGLCMIEKVSLSDYYCLPNKLFEYCFAGIPVIASDFPDIVDVVRRFDLGLCCGQDKANIKRAVELFTHDKIRKDVDIERLGELSWEAQAVKLVAVYAHVSSLIPKYS